MSQSGTLTADEITTLQSDVAAGQTPTVWFTSSAVGVQEGRSGKVVSVDDPPEGDFIQVRPAGSKDVLSFSAAEVTLVRPTRKRKAAEPEPPAATKTENASGVSERKSSRGVKTQAAAKPEATKSAPASSASSASGASATEQTRAPARRKPRQPTGATVILTADEAGQWSVEVSTDRKRVLKPKTVPASAVAQAAKALHDDVASAVEPLIDAARERQRSRVEQLQQELAEAQRVLDDLG